AVAVSVLAAGISRVALNVHYPSDVLAGWSLGYLYFLLCFTVIRPAGAPVSRNACDAGDLITVR
ncbi:phosphatase PAP2 family protein, partial [Mycobacterium sp. E2497]|uniref:phosphatase PAP2 family protein n=1 Tax=Mycobacterium sp. E2497 TaxID=1834135 RepID=UPI000A772453